MSDPIAPVKIQKENGLINGAQTVRQVQKILAGMICCMDLGEKFFHIKASFSGLRLKRPQMAKLSGKHFRASSDL